MSGSLFTQYFLDEGVATTADWALVSDAALATARIAIGGLIADFARRVDPNEANTEHDLIEPVLALLGWASLSKQETASARGRSDVPDYLLFADAAAKTAADQASGDRYRHGATIVEAKRWDVPLDHATRADAAPSTQILRYLGTVSVQSGDAIRFGILTNGRLWRLYDQKARSRLEGFVELDLAAAVGDDHLLRLFLTYFGRAAFLPDVIGATALTRALDASRSFEARVTDALAETVFASVFPDLANALAAQDPARGTGEDYLAALREAALTWLYRLLFVLYAEDRDLLPTRTRADGLRAMRESVADAIDNIRGLAERRANYDGDLRALWDQIDKGDRGIGLPPYNGGLFKDGRSPLLDRTRIPDALFAPLLDALSRTVTEGGKRLINYRDLNVQHLGSVYERLLEYELAEGEGGVVVRPQTFARKTSGSYYTPEALVMLVIRRTIAPLLDERRAQFADAATERRTQEAEYRIGWLQSFDPASAFLTLRIVDPAMGSGHFLVSLVDYLADQVMLATREASEQVDGYRSPLLDRLEAIRARILEQAAANGWRVDPAQLIDRQLVRRIILKRVIHGVDKNPMAVELAKLSLWLHTFTVGAPLSFLDHHLRCGDSLFGEWVGPAIDRLERGGLFRDAEVRSALRSVESMARIEELTDADVAEVRESQATYDAVKAQVAPAEALLSLLQGYRWIEGSAEDALKRARVLERESVRQTGPGAPARSMDLARQAWELKRRGRALDTLLEGQLGDPRAVLDMAYGRIGERGPRDADEDPAIGPLVKAAEIARVSGFLHWEVAFPNVWTNWWSAEPTGGFDAVIGNPPWDRLKMQEVEWFAARAPAIAHATRASDRKRMIAALKGDTPVSAMGSRTGPTPTQHRRLWVRPGDEPASMLLKGRGLDDSLAGQYARASEMAGLAARMANLKPDKGGQFPLLGGGDVNLYSLFVERAARLVKPDGLVGLLTPSGIAGDLSAAAFFRSVSTTGRLVSLLDYENRKIFFPDVHASFKFCAIVFGGRARTFAAAECGFFLTGTSDAVLAEASFPLTPADFAAVNPNTGTAPVFRNRRDADLTTAIYARLPVIVDKRFDPPRKPWPVRYSTMFHMTNDSHLFRTRAELEADGWYPVAGGRMRKGKAEAVALYVGRMFNHFDHRASSVTVNEENLHNAANSDPTTAAQKTDPAFQLEPQYFVDWSAVDPQREWALAFRDITNTTNERTIVSAILPGAAYGNTAALITVADAQQAALLSANLNSIVLDYVARQKLQGTHANWYIVEQLPIIPPSGYDREFGAMTARAIVAREVLHLTYVAHDMAAFARDLGRAVDRADDGAVPGAVSETAHRPAPVDSPHPNPSPEGEGLQAVRAPFAWNEADRRQRRARLDALYFHLYGIGRADAEYILSTFPIVRGHDHKAFGRYLTRDLILAQMAALDAGDTEAVIDLR